MKEYLDGTRELELLESKVYLADVAPYEDLKVRVETIPNMYTVKISLTEGKMDSRHFDGLVKAIQAIAKKVKKGQE